MDFKTWHKDVEWNKWEMKHSSSYDFTLIRDSDYRVICNFGKHRVLVYQLLYKKRNFTIVSSYDQYTLSKILGDWQNGKVYWKLKV
tara:strand:+ start:5550 stop:5807 length:258 start_codon:yes stop_codon:yes gene_type:complete